MLSAMPVKLAILRTEFSQFSEVTNFCWEHNTNLYLTVHLNRPHFSISCTYKCTLAICSIFSNTFDFLEHISLIIQN
jgi:hypothetical protein